MNIHNHDTRLRLPKLQPSPEIESWGEADGTFSYRVTLGEKTLEDRDFDSRESAEESARSDARELLRQVPQNASTRTAVGIFMPVPWRDAQTHPGGLQNTNWSDLQAVRKMRKEWEAKNL